MSGAGRAGYYKSTADCTAPQITDRSREVWRRKYSKTRYYGSDCKYGINITRTWYRSS